MFNYCSFEVPKGWYGLIDEFCNDVEFYADALHIKDKIEFVQIKEKYGELRIYYQMFIEDAEVEDTIDMLIADYNERARYTCAECGEKAVVRTVDYILPWCESCAPKEMKKVVIKN